MALFPIYGNSLQFIINNEQKTYSVHPDYPGFKVKISDVESNRARVYRDEFWNEYEIQFDSTFNKKAPIDTLIRPFRYSHQLFTELISHAANRKIELTEEFPIRNLGYYAYHKVQVEEAVAKDTLYKWMLQPSDNLLAESLLLMASGTQNDTMSISRGLELAEIQRNTDSSDLLTNKLVWVDGSGLSRYNMFKPSEIIGVLKSLYNHSTEERLFELLPQGGVSEPSKIGMQVKIESHLFLLKQEHLATIIP